MHKNTKKFFTSVMAAIICLAGLAGCTEKQSSGTEPDINGAENMNGDLFVNEGWTYGQISAGGGGYVTGVISTSEEGVYYAKTDVGGAYRWSEPEQKWKSLSYSISEDDRGYYGIDGIAADPQNAANVYLLAGTEYFSNGKTAVFISRNYGETFDIVELTEQIKVHGNGMGRGNGERIAVDPNNSDIIFIGGRTGGMLKSADGGYSWSAVESFPVDRTANGNGINIITFDPSSVKDGVTQRIYAGVSQKNEDAGNLFVSEDAGATWSVLQNSNNAEMPQRIKLDSKGNVYVCYANNEGPWNAGQGSIYKYDAVTKEAKAISPSSESFGDIIIDPEDDNRLVAVTTQTWKQQPNGSYGDVFYTSADGGENWTNIVSGMEMSDNNMPWIADQAIHWCSSLAVNPFNSNEIMVNSGNGIFACDNIWDEKPLFYFNSSGLEETVPIDIITMEDYPLVTAVLDYDGYVHEDIFTPANRHQDKIGSTVSITIAPKNRDYWAKAGGSEGEMLLTYTTDAGKTWNRITNSPEDGKTFYNGSVAFNADGSRLIWSPSNATKSYYTEDLGTTWSVSEGLIGSGFYILGDPENPDYIYACGSSSAYTSSDGGKTFSRMTGTEPSFKRFCVIPGEEGSFYMPSISGLVKVTNHGESFELVPNVKYCEAVSIGKPKNDGDPYVIYMWGMSMEADKKGLYMSEDNGQTWVRINDDLHQFGGTGNGGFVSGDLNVYGRCYMSTVGLGIIYCDKIEK